MRESRRCPREREQRLFVEVRQCLPGPPIARFNRRLASLVNHQFRYVLTREQRAQRQQGVFEDSRIAHWPLRSQKQKMLEKSKSRPTIIPTPAPRLLQRR